MRLILAHWYDGKKPGQTITVDKNTARRLIADGFAREAPKPSRQTSRDNTKEK